MGERVFEKLNDPAGLHKSPLLVFAGDALAAGGLRGLGRVFEKGRARPRRQPEFLQLCRDLTADGAIDGCLLTPADAEQLAVEEGLFRTTPITPLVRLNAETSIWSPRHGQYQHQRAQPFTTVSFGAEWPETAYCTTAANSTLSGGLECHVRLGLYSITLNNDVEILGGAENICVVVVEAMILKRLIACLPLHVPFHIVTKGRRRTSEKPNANTHASRLTTDKFKLRNE